MEKVKSEIGVSPDKEFPAITAVISTRNRGSQILDAVRSILENDYPNFNLIVIDQSDNDLTGKALATLRDNPKLTYILSASRGVSNGLNEAISQAEELVAITDDDCVPSSNWLKEIVKAFEQDEKIGVVLGNMVPGEYDPEQGSIPGFVQKQAYLLKSKKEDIRFTRGWGGCMALRRSTWSAVNGFDPVIGPGAPLKSGADRDFTFRVLARNYYVYFSPEIWVVHNGFRKRGKESRALAFRYGFGSGVQMAKHLKFRNFEVVMAELRIWFDCAIKPFFNNILVNHKIAGATPVYSFGVGFFRGLMRPVDRSSGNYKVI